MFEFQIDNVELLEDIDLINKRYQDFIDYLKAKLPEGRPKSIAITNLETSWLWAGESLMNKYKEDK